VRAIACKQKKIKVLSMLLAVAILFGLLEPVAAVPVLSAEQTHSYVLMNEEKISEAILPEGAKLRFEAGSEEMISAYQWQIKDPVDNIWVDIADGYSKYLWVTYSLVESMMAEDSTAWLRCRLEASTGEIFTNDVKVTVSRKVNDGPLYYGSEPARETPQILRSVRGTDQEFTTYSIVINYLFDDNTIAFEPYGATVAAGSPFKAYSFLIFVT